MVLMGNVVAMGLATVVVGVISVRLVSVVELLMGMVWGVVFPENINF